MMRMESLVSASVCVVGRVMFQRQLMLLMVHFLPILVLSVVP